MKILGIIISAIFTLTLFVFILISVWILFVFIFRLKSNGTLNKSVRKSVFKNKFSLAIILLFFGVSFAFIGGSTMVSTNGKRSIVEQYKNNNVFQISNSSKAIDIIDEFNSSQDSFGKMEDYVSPWIIDNTLAWKNGSSTYSSIHKAPTEAIIYGVKLDSTSSFDGYQFSDYDWNSFGWTKEEYKKAILQDLTELYSPNNKGDVFKTLILQFEFTPDEIFNTLFNSVENYAQTILFLRVFNSDQPFINLGLLNNNEILKPFRKYNDGKKYPEFLNYNYFMDNINLYSSIVSKVKDISKDISYKFGIDINLTPLLSSQKNSYQLSMINDIDFSTGNLLIDTNKNDLMSKKRNSDNVEINNLVFSNTNKNDFIKQSKLNEYKNGKYDALLNGKYNAVFQKDYVKSSKQNINSLVNMGSSINFNIYDSVLFSEITYPMIGLNILGDESSQSYIGLNLSDYIILANQHPELFNSSIRNQSFGFKLYFSSENLGKKINKNFNSLYSSNYEINKTKKEITTLINDHWFGYINLDRWNKGSNGEQQILLRTFEKIQNEYPNGWNNFINSMIGEEGWIYNSDSGTWNFSKFNDSSEITPESLSWFFVGNNITKSATTNLITSKYCSFSSFNSEESLRLITGMSEFKNFQIIINLVMYIFLAVVLIVLAMLITKRIKDSGKQIGTLKALGMSNQSIASTYIVYPIVIVGIGFLIASLLSIPVMFIFEMLISKYYYIAFNANPISFIFFKLLLIIPMVLAIGLTFIIASLTLRIPTLDLLSNKNINSPNIMVRSLGYITPKWVSFQTSYKFKGLLRGLGKSTLLFFSIFVASVLTAFAMSSSTMITHQVNDSLKYLNATSISTNNSDNNDLTKFIPLYEKDPNTGKYEKAYKIENGKYELESWKPDIKFSELITPIDYNQTFVYNLYENFWNIIDSYSNDPESPKLNIVLTQDEGLKSNLYIPNEVITSFVLTKNLLKSLDLITFNSLEKQRLDDNKINFKSIDVITNSWILNLLTNMASNLSDVENKLKPDLINAINSFDALNGGDWTNDIQFLSSIITLIKDFSSFTIMYGTDVTFGQNYYDQFSSPVVQSTMVSTYKNSSFSNYDKSTIVDSEQSKISFYYFNTLEELEQMFGAKGTNYEQKIDQWLRSDYEKIKNGERIDYIPVIANSIAVKWLDQQVEYGNIKKNSNGTYHLSIQMGTDSINESLFNDSSNSLIESNSFLSKEKKNFEADIKIVGKYFTIINFPFVTLVPFIQSYFNDDYIKNIDKFDNSISSYDSTNNTIVIDGTSDQFNSKYKTTIISHNEEKFGNLNSKINSFIYPNQGSFAVKIDNLKTNIYDQETQDWLLNDNNKSKNLNSVTTISIKNSTLNDINKMVIPSTYVQGESIEYKLIIDSFNKFFGNENSILNFNGESKNFKLDNSWIKTSGYPIQIRTLLDQVEEALTIMVASFSIIAFFAIFMSGTLIIIALKDIIDSSKREVSMLKAFGYSNLKSTSLIMSPYIFIILIAFIISIPLTLVGLATIAKALTLVTGSIFTFTVSLIQWIILASFILGLTIFLLILGFISFKKTDALEAIKATDE